MSATLPPRMRQVITLVCEERLTYPEVADRLEISLSTVRTYVSEIATRARLETGEELEPRRAIAHFYRQQAAG